MQATRSPHRRKALVLGTDTRAFLSVVRSLGRAGIEVHVAWSEPDAPALSSRYVAKAHSIPAYRPDDAGWLPGLVELMRREAFDLVIPCDDQRALPLAAERSELERWGRLALPSPEAFEVLGNKARTTELARSLGIPVPEEVVVADVREAAALGERVWSPLVVKPLSSFSLADVETKRMVRRARTREELDRLLHEMLGDGPVALQELCRGVGVGVELLVHDGRPLLTFQHERLHEPLEGGGSSYRESVPVSTELLDASVKLLEALRYTGVAMVEFKHDPDAERWVLLEVNARFWGSLPLAVAAGADFPLALFELLVEGRTETRHAYRTGVRARNLRADLKWHLTNLRADRSDPTLNSRPWPDVAREAAGSLVGLRERSDTFTLDDPAPGLAELRAMAGELAGESRSLAACAGARVARGRRRAAARADLREAGRVLFVCRGNIVRSPFAAGLAARALADGQEVASAGFLPEGRASPAAAVAAARDWQIDLSSHRSCVVTDELVKASDAVFVFDYRNYSAMASRFPGVRGRLHLLGALAHGPLLIPDPLPQGDHAYVPAYRRIADALSSALEDA